MDDENTKVDGGGSEASGTTAGGSSPKVSIFDFQQIIQSIKSYLANWPEENWVHTVYALQALGFLFVFTWILGIFINYRKMRDIKQEWLLSHFKWQMKTFWFGLLGCTAAFITMTAGLGIFIVLGGCVWLLYRVGRGWYCLSNQEPMPLPKPKSPESVPAQTDDAKKP